MPARFSVPTIAELALASVIGLLMMATLSSRAGAQSAQIFTSEKASFALETVASGLSHPWSLAFLPDGRMLVTERSGRLRIVSPDGKLSNPIAGVPKVVASGQGGLLDVALDPAFGQNRLVYLSYAEPRNEGRNGTSVARGRLNEAGTSIENLKVIFAQQPSATGSGHFGSRLVFARDGTLFITLGDRFSLRDQAQNPANDLGKLVRIRPDGSIPPDNPRPSGLRPDWRPEIWSIGHRNVQGAALHPATGQLWTAEHGARGGDEINTPQAGKNYGWPIITYGVDYSGAKIGIGTRKEGLEQPLYYWDPSIAPSGLAFYTADRFPAWKGNAFVGGLAGAILSRLELDGTRVVHEERLLGDLGYRYRDIRQGPDGLLYLLTDEEGGKLLRLRPRP